MITQKNSIYTFEGSYSYPFILKLSDTFKGEISVDIKGFFKNGLFSFIDADCKILGHIKNKNSITTLSFILALDDLASVDCIYSLSNITSKYNPVMRNFEGHYIGKWYTNLQTSIPVFDPRLLRDYSKFEEIVNSAKTIGGYAELDLIQKEWRYKTRTFRISYD
jgi:hypothetical protein